MHSKQLGERQDVQMAHNLQYAEFNKAWDRYLEEYDRMAQVYIKQMTERHAEQLREFQVRARRAYPCALRGRRVRGLPLAPAARACRAEY